MNRRQALATLGAATLASSIGMPVRAASPAKIGTLCPVTGAGGSYGPAMETAVRRQIEKANALGGVGGFTLQGFYENSETDPNAAVIAAKKLISADGVGAILGEWGSGETLAVGPLCIAGKVVQFTSGGDDKITDQAHDGYIFRTECGGTLWGRVFAETALTAGAKTAVAAAVQAPFALAYTRHFSTYYQQLGGKLVGDAVIYADGAASYRSELDRLLAGKPELVFVMGYTPDTVILIKEAFRAGAEVKWLVPGYVGLDPEFIKAIGTEAANGIYVVDPALDNKSPGYAAFMEAMGGKQEGLSYAAQTYDQATLVALAVAAMKKGDGTAIRDGIRKVTAPGGTPVYNLADGLAALRDDKAVKYHGVSSPLDFDVKGNITSGTFTIFEIVDGKAEPKRTQAVSL